MSEKKKRFLAIAMLIALGMIAMMSGCAASLRLGKEPPPVDIPTVSQDVECRIFMRSGWTPMLELPELSRTKPPTSEELNVVQANYIRQLRASIVSERTQKDEEYTKYVRRCLR